MNYLKNRRVFGLLAMIMIVILPILYFSGCSRAKEGTEKKVTIRVMYYGALAEIKLREEIKLLFEKENPGIEIRLEHFTWNVYQRQLLTQIAGGNAPDIAVCEASRFPAFYEKGVFLGLNPFIKKDKDFDLRDFFPQLIAHFTIDGELYIVPTAVQARCNIFYNKDLFDKAGLPYPNDDWDWHDFLEAAGKLTIRDKEGKIIQYGFQMWPDDFTAFVFSNGGKVVDNVRRPTRCVLNSPQAIEGIQFAADLVNKYKVSLSPTELQNSGMGGEQLFALGKVAMHLDGAWDFPIFRKYPNLRWDIAMFPKGSKGDRGFSVSARGYGILKTTRHPKGAWKVVKFFSGKEAQEKIADSGRAMPANIQVAKGSHWAGSSALPENKGMLINAMNYIVFYPFTSKWSEIDTTVIRPAFYFIFTGEKTVEEEVADVVPKVNKLLEER